MKDITSTITKPLAVLGENGKGYTKEANFISWNGNAAKLDIREWHPNHERCGKGITLTDDNKKQLAESYAQLRPLDAFANGRTARVLLDNSVKAQSIRFARELAEHPAMTDEDKRSILTTLTDEDIKKATEKTVEVSKSNESKGSKADHELDELVKSLRGSADETD